MSDGSPTTAPSPVPFPGNDPTALSRDALRLPALVILGIAYMGLALAAYLNFGIMEGLTGPVVPLAFIAVTALMLPTAVSYAVMNGRRPSTGSTFTWLWEATAPGLGIWLGWILVVTYIVGAALQPVMFGLFFNSLLNFFGIQSSSVTAMAGGVLAVLAVGLLTKRGVRLSARAIGVFICIEAGFVALLSVYIVIKKGLAGHLSWQPLMPSHATSWSGFLTALLFAVLSIAAFDVVAPVAEEARSPRSLVPRATILVTLAAGAYWAFTSFGIVNGVPAWRMASYVRSGQFTPIYLVAADYLGPLKVMVPLTGFTAILASLSAVSTAANRQLFALARERMAPHVFAITDKRKSPWNAQLLVLACCVALPILVTVYQNANPELAFMWIGQAYVFLILIPYTLTCAANIIYHFRYHSSEINWLAHVVAPALGIVINCYILYKNFLQQFVFHATSFRSETSITVACFALVAAAVIATVAGVSQRRDAIAAPFKLDEAASPER